MDIVLSYSRHVYQSLGTNVSGKNVYLLQMCVCHNVKIYINLNSMIETVSLNNMCIVMSD